MKRVRKPRIIDGKKVTVIIETVIPGSKGPANKEIFKEKIAENLRKKLIVWGIKSVKVRKLKK